MIAADAKKDDYRFAAVIDGIVNSVPFRMRMAQGRPDTRTAGDAGAAPAEPIADARAH
jgi:hypothetical protein